MKSVMNPCAHDQTIAFAPASKQERYGLARVLLREAFAFRLPKYYSYAMHSRGFVVAIYALPLTRLGALPYGLNIN